MVETTPGFSGFKITNYYKYILYLAGVILVLSLFVDAKGVDNAKLRTVSFWIVVGGLSIWLFRTIWSKIDDWFRYQGKKSYRGYFDYEDWYPWYVFIDYAAQIAVWIWLFWYLLKMM